MTGIYLDYQASTPLAPQVATLMQGFLRAEYGNPHSTEHAFGRKAAGWIEGARQQVAAAIGARPSEVIFTAGATESNNTAIKGSLSGKNHQVITCATEHACVLAAAKTAEDCVVLRPSPNGLLDPEQVRAAITPATRLVSVMLVNNEIGVIQPIAQIAEICRAAGVLVHVDAAQALGRVAVDVQELGVDMLSLSAHKIYGPKGIGALFVRRGVRLAPLLHGGGQERNIRSGTLSPMLCAGFGLACEIAVKLHGKEQARTGKLAKILLQKLDEQAVIYRLNGSAEHRIADNLNLHFAGMAQADFMSALGDRIAVSSSSACNSAQGKGSHVLRALGHDEGTVATNIRLCIGRPTTEVEVLMAAACLFNAWKSLA